MNAYGYEYDVTRKSILTLDIFWNISFLIKQENAWMDIFLPLFTSRRATARTSIPILLPKSCGSTKAQAGSLLSMK